MLRRENLEYPALILTASIVLFCVKDAFSFLLTKNLAGRDLASNYAFTWLMKQNLLQGEIFNWSNEWLLGFPSFEMYPPLFFIFNSGISLFLGNLAGLQTIFRYTVFLSVFLIPLATYYFTRDVFGDERAFMSGVYTLLFIFVYPPVSQAYQVFSTGLVAQGFAFFLLIPAIGFMLRDEKKYKAISGVLLGFTALSHPFVAIVGFLVSGSMTLLDRDLMSAIPGMIGGVIVLPWILKALSHLQYTDSYTFDPANTGLFLYLILPLIVAGGLEDKKTKPLLLTFGTLLSLSIFEVPLISQELRFYTYSLGVGSILAGLGSHRVYRHISKNFDLDKKLVLVMLVIPVAGLSLQAELPQSWSHDGGAEQLFDQLQSMEKGRVLVETSNSSIHDSYVVQANLPLKTKHWAVNDVHLDSSTSASYILTLESWISEDSLYNPICRTCNTSANPEIISERLDGLGVRYITVRTLESKELMEKVAEPKGKYGEYWLFENKEGYQIVEKLKYKPVALKGSYERWKKVNDVLLHSRFEGEVIWLTDERTSNYSETINMREKSVEQIKKEIQDAELERTPEGELSYTISEDSIQISSLVPVKVKTSYFRAKHRETRAGTSNTVIIPQKVENWKTN